MLFFNTFRGQFISLGEVVQAHLGDSVVDATFSQEIAPLLFPSWQVQNSMKQVQSSWRNYTFRYPYKNMETHRQGYNSEVHAMALQLSVLMATSSRFLRYFNAETVRGEQNYPLHPTAMTRCVWKETAEDIHQMQSLISTWMVQISQRLYALTKQNLDQTREEIYLDTSFFGLILRKKKHRVPKSYTISLHLIAYQR